MSGLFSLPGRKLLLPFLAAGCFLVMSHGSAFAQVEGCNPNVLDAMNKASQARVAARVAADEAIFPQPDHPSAVTCANQAYGKAARDGGAIFSGDFTNELRPVVEPALTSSYDDYADSSGMLTSSVDYTATALDPNYNCDGIENNWTAQKDDGIKAGVPPVMFSNLRTGTLPAGTVDPDFSTSWNAAQTNQNVFTDLDTAMGALPAITAIPAPPAPDATECEVLMAYNVIPGPCP